MQEEIRRNTGDGTSSKEVEEDFSLASKEKKVKGKKSQGEVVLSLKNSNSQIAHISLMVKVQY